MSRHAQDRPIIPNEPNAGGDAFPDSNPKEEKTAPWEKVASWEIDVIITALGSVCGNVQGEIFSSPTRQEWLDKVEKMYRDGDLSYEGWLYAGDFFKDDDGGTAGCRRIASPEEEKKAEWE